jgi:hypothetical protein
MASPANRKYIPWKRVMEQLRAGHPLPDIAKWTVEAHIDTLRRRARTDLEPALYEEFRRLVWKNKRPSGGQYGIPGRRAVCGTTGGATAHYRRGEPLCFPCKVAKSDLFADYYQRKKQSRRDIHAFQEDDR